MNSNNGYIIKEEFLQKEDVHDAIKDLDKGIYPNVFKILPDFVGKDPSYCNIMCRYCWYKPSLAYMYWKETGDDSVLKGIIKDALIMNLDDMVCVGAINNLILSSTIGRNKNLIPGEVVNL